MFRWRLSKMSTRTWLEFQKHIAGIGLGGRLSKVPSANSHPDLVQRMSFCGDARKLPSLSSSSTSESAINWVSLTEILLHLRSRLSGYGGSSFGLGAHPTQPTESALAWRCSP